MKTLFAVALIALGIVVLALMLPRHGLGLRTSEAPTKEALPQNLH